MPGLLVTRDRPLSVGQIQGGERQAMVASRHTFMGSGGAATVPLNVRVERRAATDLRQGRAAGRRVRSRTRG